MTRHRTAAVASAIAIMLPSLVLAENASTEGAKISPARAIRRALASKRRALEACGVKWGPEAKGARKAFAKFALSFEGTIRDLRIEGLPKNSASHPCLMKELARLKLPRRLAYIVESITLPLPLAPGADSTN